MSISNTATRIIVSVIAIPAIVLACYFGEYYFFAFVLGIGILSYYEFWLFVKNKDINANLIIGIISVGMIITNSYKSFIAYYPLLITILLALTIIELFRNKNSAIINLGTTLLGHFILRFVCFRTFIHKRDVSG